MRSQRILLLAILLSSIQVVAGTYREIHSFDFNDYANTPFGGLALDRAGNLYGVAAYGLDYTDGTIFELTRSENGWIYQTRFEFGVYDGLGTEPIGGLALDEGNNVYSTNSYGGQDSSCGTVFSLSAGTVIHYFTGPDGCDPEANLSYFNGRLWGTTKSGGSQGKGTVFSMDGSGGSFHSDSFWGKKGREPLGGINMWGYGTTYSGGGSSYGNVYKLDPIMGFVTKHSFSPEFGAGYGPRGDLLTVYLGGVRTMYGTTSAGGKGGGGTVYSLTEIEPNSDRWRLKVLYSFVSGDKKGWAPMAGVTIDATGHLYGTTLRGGKTGSDCGTVFKLTPGISNMWTYTVLHSFDLNNSDGCHPTSGVAVDNAGNVFGTTSEGGEFMGGVVYEITQ